MTPEARARLTIDKQLADAGWQVQDLKTANLGVAPGVGVRLYSIDAGPADYLLFVDRRPIDVIEAKREEAGENLTTSEPHTERYANATLQWTSMSEITRSVQSSLRQSAAQRQNILCAAFVCELVPQDPTDEAAAALLSRIRDSREGAKPSAGKRATAEHDAAIV